MKFVERIFLIFCLIFVICIGTAFAETGKVNVTAIRLRKENNTNSEIITNIYENDKVEIIEDSGDWYKIKYDGNVGYVKKEYITVDSSKKDNTNVVNNTVSNEVANKIEKNDTVTNSVENKIQDNTVDNSVVNNTNNTSDSLILTTNSTANLRNIPSMISQTIAILEQSKQLTKISEMGNWVQVTDGVNSGWIPKSKILTTNTKPVESSDFTNEVEQNDKTNTVSNEQVPNTNTAKENIVDRTTTYSTNKTGIVNVETAKVREKASTSSGVIGFLDYDDKVTITAEEGEWYKVTASDASGYVNKKLITVKEDAISSRSLTEERKTPEEIDNTTVSQEINNSINESLVNQSNNNNNKVVDYAKQYLGYPYVVGGKTPTSGFDCSGFTRYIFKNFGYNLGSTAASQTGIGVEVTRNDLQEGDLILFYNEEKTSIGHTGIYLGNGDFIHAANPQRGVVIDNINSNSYYNERFVSARRIVN